MLCAQLILQRTAECRRKTVRSHRTGNNQVDVLRLSSGIIQCPLCCGQGYIDRLHVHGNAPLADAGALHNPFVRCVHHLFQHLIGQARFRQEAACSRNYAADCDHSHPILFCQINV